MIDCVFEEKCINAEGTECYTCQYNPSACTQSNFEWNGEGQEPTDSELDEAIVN